MKKGWMFEQLPDGVRKTMPRVGLTLHQAGAFWSRAQGAQEFLVSLPQCRHWV